MAAGFRANRRTLVAAVLVLGIAWAWRTSGPGGAAEGGTPADEMAVTRARTEAKLLHAVYASTLDSMHHHYFRTERAIVPARALEDVFADMTRQMRIRAKWIAVNTAAMSIDHEPRSDFEKQAARALAAGRAEFERIDDGYYHRAGAIPLTSGCVSCHVGFLSRASSAPRFAGLVISVPLARE